MTTIEKTEDRGLKTSKSIERNQPQIGVPAGASLNLIYQ